MKRSVEAAFARALWVQALAAGSALALSAASPGSLAAALAIGGVIALVFRLAGWRLSRHMESGVAIVACAAVPVDVALHDFELAPPLSRFLLILQLAKLLGPRERRDEGTILVVALVHMAVAASSTIEPVFLPLVILYGCSAAYSLALRQLRGPDATRPSNPRVARSFDAALAALGVVACALGTAIFFAIPRVGAKLLPIPHAQTDRLSGYSDTIALDETGKIRESQNRAFRVDVIQRGRLGSAPLWRGQALSEYDGKKWSPIPWAKRIGHEFGNQNGLFDLEQGEVPKDATILEVYLEPMSTQTIFTPGHTHSVEYKTPPPPLLNRDAFGGLISMWFHRSAVSYKLVCVPGPTLPKVYSTRRFPQHTKLDKVIEMCTRLPEPIRSNPQIKRLALDVLKAAGAESASAAAKGRALADWLQNNYRYTLDAKMTPGAERVTDFLFTTKEGHCEVFAGALCVLLRSVDVPARVVNGFRGGEYHPWTDTYTVMDKHAHAWVEALADDGWITLDPTPAGNGEEEQASGLIATLDDFRVWFEIRWFKNVVAYDMNDQWHFLKNTKEWALPWLDDLREWVGRVPVHRSPLLFLAALLASALVLGTALATYGPRRILGALREAASWLRDRLRARSGAELAARELAPVLRALERLGVKRAPGETAQDLARSALERLGERARPFEAVVPLYYAARYGGRELTPFERDQIREAARALLC